IVADLQGKENRNSFKRTVDAPKHCSRKRKRDVVASHYQRHSADKHHSSSTSTGTDKRHEPTTKRRHKLNTGKKHVGGLKKEKMSKKEEKRHKTLVKKHAVYNKEVHDAENSLRKRLQNMLGLEVPLLQQENQKAGLVELAGQEGEFDSQEGELETMEGELESQAVELESQEGELGSQELVLEPQ
ncbi:unnamed protein product, partial [Timema podura]|nr:unnamed protein product [Timema podura]